MRAGRYGTLEPDQGSQGSARLVGTFSFPSNFSSAPHFREHDPAATLLLDSTYDFRRLREPNGGAAVPAVGDGIGCSLRSKAERPSGISNAATDRSDESQLVRTVAKPRCNHERSATEHSARI